MGKADWSLGQLEQDLAAGFAFLDRAENRGGLGAGESAVLADGVLQCMNAALMKVSESLEAQAQLSQELVFVRDEFHQFRSAQCLRIQSLEDEVSSLRKALSFEQVRLQRALGLVAGAASLCPSDEYVDLPLVLRSSMGEFFGVTDRLGQALNLAGFLLLVERAGTSGQQRQGRRVVASCWDACGEGWSLTLSMLGPRTCSYMLETHALRTPSGNRVVLLADMCVDGKSVPQEFVVQMFRQLRDSLQEK